MLTVGPHGFYWFQIEPATPASADGPSVPEVRVRLTGDTLLDDPDFERALEARLPRLLPTKRWFVSKARHVRATNVVDRIALAGGDHTAAQGTVGSQGGHGSPAVPPRAQAGPTERVLFLVDVEFTEGEPEQYALPLTATPAAPPEPGQTPPTNEVGTVLHATSTAGDRRWVVQDGMTDPAFARLLLETALHGGEAEGTVIRLAGRRVGDESAPLPDLDAIPPKIPDREQSNSNVLFGDQLILKLYRRLAEGVNPELEVGEHLTARVGFANTAPLAGAIELAGRGGPRTLAVALTYVPNEGDAWGAFLDYGQRYFEALDAVPAEQVAALCLPGDPGCTGGEEGPPQDVVTLIAEPLELARVLGRRTAEMHAALADDRGDAAFAPEPYGMMYQRSLLQSMRNTTRATMQALEQRADTLGGEAREMARAMLGREADVLRAFRELTGRPIRAPRIRIHGDYHLGQVLWTGKDFVIIDFEGEPIRSVGERRLKRSPFRDVAGMVRSFDYAAWHALRRHRELMHPDAEGRGGDRHVRGAIVWGAWLGREFVRAYVVRLREVRPDLVPPSTADAELLLRSWVLEKALYEVRYELNSRPDWVDIPLRAVAAILGPPHGGGGGGGGSEHAAAQTTPAAIASAVSATTDGSQGADELNGRKERGQGTQVSG